MTIFIDGHAFGYEMQRVAQMFFPGEKVLSAVGAPPEEIAEGFVHTRCGADELYAAFRDGDGMQTALREPFASQLSDADREHRLGVLLYRLLSKRTGIYPQWGALTGIRPVKLFVSAMEAGMDEAALRRHFMEDCLVSQERFSLALETARAEQPLLARSTPDSFSLYVSIPFCPTRCSYCSFVSHSVEQAARLIPAYVDKLCEELAYTAQIAARLGLKLRTVYFGGGTPTTLTAEQLHRVTGTIAEHFDTKQLWEYTVEAGRPDTVTPEKLRVIRDAGAGRISINPQTLSDDILRLIGRKHSTQQLLRGYAMARDAGFESINMDLIAGLPTDTAEGFRRTVDGVLELAPENITVHTLTVKRGSRLTFEEAREELRLVGDMVDYARAAVGGAGLAPYYLYRQNGTLGNLENVGYAKPGTEGLYNVYIMDETHSILAVGAGASTKLRHPSTGQIERIFNYKYPYEYIERFHEAKARKDRVAAFYGGGTETACKGLVGDV